jgi:hypothetical protein
MTEHGIQALDELRESLREAARRDIEARPRRRRSRRRIGGLAAVLVVAAGGAAATAADLNSTGKPLPKPKLGSTRYQPAPGASLQLAVRADDKPLAWGVKVFKSNNGQTCVIAGQINGIALGLLEGGKFHPYPKVPHGSCGRPRKLRTPVTLETYQGQGRTIIYGIAGTGAKHVTALVDGQPRTAPVGDSETFLFVFKGESAVVGRVTSD